jgi:hypothetical protein
MVSELRNYKRNYTQNTSRVGISAAPKHRNSTIVSYPILLILGNLRSPNCESFRVAQIPTLEVFWVYTQTTSRIDISAASLASNCKSFLVAQIPILEVVWVYLRIRIDAYAQKGSNRKYRRQSIFRLIYFGTIPKSLESGQS